MLIRGDKLTTEQRRQVLAAFVHRHTIENARTRGVKCVMCADSVPPPHDGSWHARHVAVQTDDQWLADHAFHFVKDGSRLHDRRHFAEPAYLAAEVS